MGRGNFLSKPHSSPSSPPKKPPRRWGGGSRPHRDDWKSRVSGQVSLTFYAILWGLSLWGLVWHYCADQLMSQGFDQLSDNIDVVVRDTQLFLNNTAATVDHWTDVNFAQELAAGYEEAVINVAGGMNRALDEINEPQNTGMTRVTGVPDFMEEQLYLFNDTKAAEIRTNLETLHDPGLELYDTYLQIKSAAEWERILQVENCHPHCERLQVMAATLIYDLGLISYPDVVSDIVIDPADLDAIALMREDTDVFVEQLARLGQDFVEDNRELFEAPLQEMEEFFSAGAAEISRSVRNLQFADPGVGPAAEKRFEGYFNFAYYATIVPAVFMTAVLALYLAGYLVGLYGAVGSRTRTVHASRLVCWGTLLFFVFSAVFWIFTTLLFVSGTTIQKLYCDTLEEPEDSEMYERFDSEINDALRRAFNNTGFAETQWDVADMLKDCDDGKTIYDVLHMRDAYDVELLRVWRAYVDADGYELALRTKLNETVQSVAPRLAFYDPAVEAAMTELQNKTLPIVDAYINDYVGHEFRDVVRNVTLGNMSLVLNQLDVNDPDVATVLTLVNSMYAGLPELESVWGEVAAHAAEYDEIITYTTISVYEIVDEAFQTWAMVSSEQLVEKMDILETELVDDFQDALALFDWFADHSVDMAATKLGECTPAYAHLYEAAINYSCYQLADPLNSVWSGMGLILVVFVPFLACAVKVEGIFRQVKVRREDDDELSWSGGKDGEVGIKNVSSSSSGVEGERSSSSGSDF